MPVYMDLPEWQGRYERKNVPVATKEELLDFANKVRKAGGAKILPALLPSWRGESNQCLVANALNFECEVNSHGDSDYWDMRVANDMVTLEQVNAIEEILGTSSTHNGFEYIFPLPEHIGNAADAYDRGVAFQDMVA